MNTIFIIETQIYFFLKKFEYYRRLYKFALDIIDRIVI
jgi:hypothetical protein